LLDYAKNREKKGLFLGNLVFLQDLLGDDEDDKSYDNKVDEVSGELPKEITMGL